MEPWRTMHGLTRNQRKVIRLHTTTVGKPQRLDRALRLFSLRYACVLSGPARLFLTIFANWHCGAGDRVRNVAKSGL